MPQKVKTLGVEQEEGWTYFLDDNGDVSRRSDESDELEKVTALGFKIAADDANLYFIDEEGDLSAQTIVEYKAAVGAAYEQVEGEILADYESRDFASTFSAEENRYWIVKANRRVNDLREMLQPRVVHTWRTARLPRDIAGGDRVLFWESAPHLRVVGIGEVGGWEREKDIFGDSHFWLVYQSKCVDGGPTVEELRKEPLFSGASFLKAAVAGTLFPITPAQAASLAGRLAAHDPLVAQMWPDVLALDGARPEEPKVAAPTVKPVAATKERLEAPKIERAEASKPRIVEARGMEVVAVDEAEVEPTDTSTTGPDDTEHVQQGHEEALIVCSLGIEKDDGWTYRVDPKGVYRVPDGNPDARRQWVYKGAVPMEEGRIYFLDDDGDVVSFTYEGFRTLIRRNKIAESNAPRLAEPLEPPSAQLTAGASYRILSVHGPWAWAIMFAGKNIENRSWSTPHRGPILIHASSKKYVGKALDEARSFIAECSGMPLEKVPFDFPRRQILGMVDVDDCTVDHESPWAESFGTTNWVLSRPRRLAIPVDGIDGKLNLWSWTVP